MRFCKAREYLERRTSKDNKELFYLEHSAYRNGINNSLMSQFQEKRENFYVLYLHSFTDDHHRYGYDQFDSIWDWTIFILNYFRDHPEKTLFVKTHPNTTHDSVHFVYREDFRALTYLQTLYSSNISKNIHFLPSTFSNSHIVVKIVQHALLLIMGILQLKPYRWDCQQLHQKCHLLLFVIRWLLYLLGRQKMTSTQF